MAEAQRLAHLGSWEWDTSSDKITWSDELYRIFGLGKQEFGGTYQRFLELIHPDDRRRVAGAIRNSLKDRQPFDFFHRTIRPDGSLRILHCKGRVFTDKGGNITKMSGTAQDVTEIKLAEEALRDSEERHRLLFESSPQPMWVYDLETLEFLAVNNAAVSHYGYSREEFLSMTIKDIRPEEEVPSLLEEVAKLPPGIRVSRGWKHRKRDGTLIDVEITSHDIVFSGKSARLVLAKDITSQKLAEERLREEKGKAQRYLDIAGVMLLALDRDGRVTMINKKGCEILGHDEAEVIGKNWVDTYIPDKIRGRVKDAFSALMSGSTRQYEYFESPILTGKGEEKLIAWHTVLVKDGPDRVTGTLSSGEDITESRRMEEAIRFNAYYDILTGLPNRALLIDHIIFALDQAQQARQMMAIVYVDLDRFKNVTDSLGHVLGDELLKTAAARLKTAASEANTIARIGGDEYALLLSRITHEDDAADVAKKILAAFRKPWMIDSHTAHVTASVGISIYPNDGNDAETLLRNADIAMSQVKEHGRNNYQFYNSAMNFRVLERVRMENSIRYALEHGGFTLFYQPLINMDTKQLTGLEALIRWKHPKLGMLEPIQFIRLAEDTGLIIPIGEWVFHTACAQIKRWEKAGFSPVCVSVNLSAGQFLQPDLVGMVSRVLEETGLDSRCLDIEITESTAMQDIETTLPRLAELNNLGIRFSIDDFGTGYSSLSYLKKLPIQKLKIDKSFIAGLMLDPDYKAIVHAVIVMAHNLKLGVIAEGVENEEQFSFLHATKCDEMQGYLFSRPLPPEEVERFLAAGKPHTQPK